MIVPNVTNPFDGNGDDNSAVKNALLPAADRPDKEGSSESTTSLPREVHAAFLGDKSEATTTLPPGGECASPGGQLAVTGFRFSRTKHLRRMRDSDSGSDFYMEYKRVKSEPTQQPQHNCSTTLASTRCRLMLQQNTSTFVCIRSSIDNAHNCIWNKKPEEAPKGYM